EKQVERPAVTARRPGARILICPVATTANHRQPGWLTGRAAPAGEGRQSGPLMSLPRTCAGGGGAKIPAYASTSRRCARDDESPREGGGPRGPLAEGRSDARDGAERRDDPRRL